jgi:hypothetical protein
MRRGQLATSLKLVDQSQALSLRESQSKYLHDEAGHLSS